MELPALKLPEIPLPFEIPTLMHPPIDHFAVAIPVLVLLIELINLVAKKRAIGFVSFFLLIVGAVAMVGAYLSGVHDGKEAFDALSQAGREELKEHRVLGTYLMLASGVVLLFKLLSAMLQRGLMKATYLLVLIVFVAGILKQGKDGGELVYEYGANVERVQELDSDLFDAKEALEEAEEKIKELKESASSVSSAPAEASAAKSVEAPKPTAVPETTAPVVEETVQQAQEAAANVQEEAAQSVEQAKEEATSTVDDVQESVIEHTQEAVQQAETKVEEAATSMQEAAQEHLPH